MNAPSEAIRRGHETNRLELSCVGATIAAAVNGTPISSVEDTTYAAGELMLVAGLRTGQGGAVEARFDNRLVVER